jgi:regulation of enolase protein 1 (concanavalin A-like superfamily)
MLGAHGGKALWGLTLLAEVLGSAGLVQLSPALPEARAADYSPADIGNPAQAGAFTSVEGGYDVVAGGSDIGGTADQFHFDYQSGNGDFDARVRLQSLPLSDLFAKAGLMARETLEANSRFAAVLATPTLSGCLFTCRASAGSQCTVSGFLPINYPDTWLRLQRTGGVFNAYAGFDGRHWTQLGTASLALPDTVYFGLATCSHNTNRSARAQFRELGAVSEVAAGAAARPWEPLGPASRRTGLVISEIMYHPLARPDGRNLQFIELFNAQSFPEDLSGYRLAGDVDYTFAPGTVIPAGGFIVVAAAPADVQAVYGGGGVLGGWSGDLPRATGRVRLRNQAGAVLLEVNYAARPPWPAAADGAGPSLVLARPSYGQDNPEAWAASAQVGGSPGQVESYHASPLDSVLINELLAHTDPPLEDYVELYNHSNQAVDISGCVLTDNPATNKFVVPPQTTIDARGFVWFGAGRLGFGLHAAGESLYFKAPDGTRVLDAVRYEAQENGVSYGRYPDGAREFYRLAGRTPGAPNSAVLVSEVVINEIMYRPISDNDDDQYVELHNRGADSVELGGWRFVDGIDYEFPPNARLGPGAYLVVAKNAARLMTNYPNLNPGNTFGDFGGRLAHGGERLALAQPHPHLTTNLVGDIVTNWLDIVVDEVSYGTGGRWGKWSDGWGSSLELIEPRSNHRLAANWADSDETAKAPWTTIQTTGVLDNGRSDYPVNLQVFLEGEGECLVDNVEVIGLGGTNLVSNSTFEDGVTGWVMQGTQDQSSWESGEGYQSNKCLHLRSSGRGDPGANRIRTGLLNASSLRANTTATIRAKVRWLKGCPEILLRLRGNWLEAAGRMATPQNAGTPGARNSRAAEHAGPAIYAVRHDPVLPAANEPVVVSARVHHPDGVGQILLNYRIDPATTPATVAMADDGSGGDAVAGDGVFSATIPGQPSGKLAAFHVAAVDKLAGATNRFPADAPARECLVRFGETQPFGSLPVYRLWLTAATVSKWGSRLKLHNGPLDGTFVYGNVRAIYNIGACYAGSPFIRPGYSGPAGALCGYSFQFPPDDLFFGVTDVALDWPVRDSAAQMEQVACWMASRLDIPYNYRRFIHLFVNGTRRGQIYEDAQRPNNDTVEEWTPEDTDGDFFKVDDWFEFADDGASFVNTDATLQRFVTTGNVKKLARYRWNWRKRFAHSSANDYTSLFGLVDAVNTSDSGAYTTNVEQIVDVDEWMRTFCLEHLVGNWDAYGYSRGKNMYTYKPTKGKWLMITWDIDFVLGASGDGPTTSMYAVNDPTIGRMYNHPPFARAYYRAMYDAVHGPLVESVVNPLMDAYYAALLNNKVSVTAPNGGKTYIRSRRNYLLGLLAGVSAPFAITTNSGKDFTTATNLLTLAGTAPVAIKTLEVNGVNYPVTWTSVTAWSLRLPLTARTNALTVQGYDSRGNLFSNSVARITVTYTGAVERPQDCLVFNEIMYHPAAPNAEFVELYNTSSKTTFDLSGWRIEGVGFTFAEGSVISPRGCVVVVGDRTGFAAAYGANVPVAGEFPGRLSGGERLRLVKPGAAADQDQVIAEVKYRDHAPWPTAADGWGPSLQLIDASQDGRRLANWTAAGTNDLVKYTPGAPNSVRANLAAFPPLWLNEVQARNLSGPVDGLGHRAPWLELYNAGATSLDLNQCYLANNYTNLTQWQFPSGAAIEPGQFLVVWADGHPEESGTNELHTSFALDPVSGAVALSRLQLGRAAVLDYLEYSYLSADRSYGEFPDGQPLDHQVFHYPTPGGTNNPASAPVRVFINEWMAANNRTLANPIGQGFDDWFELYNAGTNTVDLAGYRLTSNLTNTTKFTIPPGFTIGPDGFLLVWADNNDEWNSPTNGVLHVNFKLAKEGDSIGLFAPDGTLVDSVTFGTQTADVSQGRYPDGSLSDWFFMDYPTPGDPNIVALGNTPPVLAPIAAQVADEGGLVAFTASATDADAGQTLSFSLGPGAPEGATIDARSGVFTWRPTEAQGPGIYSIPVRVTDNGLPPLTVSRTALVQVNEVNLPPVLAPIADQAVNEGEVLSFRAVATDPDLPPQPLTFSLAAGAPAGASIAPTDGVFTWQPTEAQGPGAYTITVRVQDNGTPELGDEKLFVVNVAELNSPPALQPIGDQFAAEGGTLSFTAVAQDPDIPAQTLTFSLDPGAPDGATIQPATGVFTWTPAPNQVPSTNSVTIRVTDNGVPSLDATQTARVMAVKPNHPPLLEPISDQSVAEGQLLRLRLAASDPDPGQSLTFGLAGNPPAGATIIALNATNGIFSWTPSEAQGPSTNLITVEVSDDGLPSLSDRKSFTVVVSEVNGPPVLAAIADQFVTQGDTLTLKLQASDSDQPANRLFFSLGPGAPAGLQIEPTTGTLTWTPATNQAPSANNVTVRVADDGQPPLSASRAFTVWVSPAPRWQFVSATGTASSSLLYVYLETEGEVYIDDLMLVPGSSPGVGKNTVQNGDFETQLSGPWVVSPNHADSSLTARYKHSGQRSLHVVASTGGATKDSSIYQNLTPALVSEAAYALSFWYLPGANSTTLTVRLSGRGVTSTTTISPVANRPPVLAAIADQSVKAGATVAFTASAADPDMPAQTLLFSLAPDAPTGAAINPQTGAFAWTPLPEQAPSTNQITVRVMDSGSPALVDQKTFKVTVLPVAVPARIVGIEVSAQGLTRLTWSAVPGISYFVQYRPSLTGGAWIDLLPPVVADSQTATFTDPRPPGTGCYYRIGAIGPP